MARSLYRADFSLGGEEMSSKRRMVLWLHAAEYDYLLSLAEAGLEGASATFKRIVQAMRSRNIRNVDELEQALGGSRSKDAQSEDSKAG